MAAPKAPNALLVAAGKKFKLGSLDTNGDARVPVARAYSAAARQLGSLVRRVSWGGSAWLVVDSSLRDEAIAAYLKSAG